MGLTGIRYLGRVATYLPIIPLVVLLIALFRFGGSAGGYKIPAESGGGDFPGAALLMVGYIVGFFATAGAAGVDFGKHSRDSKDVQWGGIVGILAAIVVTAGISVLAVAGAHASGALNPAEFQNPADAYVATNALKKALSPGLHKAVMIGLTIAAFPGACFSAFIAANSFTTVLPKVPPFLSVGIGTVVSIILAVTGIASNLAGVFGIIGASFGPIVGAMTVDYFLADRNWPGPREGWNIAGWVAWACGFVVGIAPILHGAGPTAPNIVCAPVAAFIVGAVVYLALSKPGFLGKSLPMGSSDPKS